MPLEPLVQLRHNLQLKDSVVVSKQEQIRSVHSISRQLVEMLNMGDQFLFSPHADSVEVFQAQPDEIKAGMAGSALRFLLVQLYERPNTRQWIVGGSD